ncbi:MAG TPA: rhomboid family intramembrane serine protease [Caldimonas sp.]|jgi:membrane associated rhomboid family serine protease|nr:rhomboid family intramembrane serine protease [Caldimonas sp.]HEX2539999.1 rhomboid family intramembrane serine protease [Caldimonas sp.]
MADLIAISHGAPASAVLLAVIMVASAIGLAAAPSWLDRSVFRPYWFLRRGELWTPVTSAFMHADVAHLLFNAFTFWAFAFDLERAIGSGRFLALYAIGLVASDVGTWIRHRHDETYATLGASGAILAVLFASILYFPTASIYILPLPVPIPAPLFALAYLAYTWFASRRGRGRVNHDAHLSGAVAGVAFVVLTDFDVLQRALRAFAA